MLPQVHNGNAPMTCQWNRAIQRNIETFEGQSWVRQIFAAQPAVSHERNEPFSPDALRKSARNASEENEPSRLRPGASCTRM